MSRYAVLLRGINVGGRSVVAMADLRAELQAAGFGHVRTLLNSGNVVLTSELGAPQVEAAVAQCVSAVAQRDVTCVAVTPAELERVIAVNPLADVATKLSWYQVTFYAKALERAAFAEVDPQGFAPEAWVIGERELYFWHADGIHTSAMARFGWDKLAGQPGTARNWNTVLKLAAALAEIPT